MAFAWAGPVALVLDVAEDVIVAWVDVTQLVPRGTSPLRHDIGVADVLLLAIAEIQGHVCPLGGLRQRWVRLRICIVWVKGNRLVVLYLRQLDRQHGLRQSVWQAILVVHDWEWLAPVALARKQPVAQLVLDLLLAVSLLHQPINGGSNALGLAQPIKVQSLLVRRVHVLSVTGEGFLRNVTIQHSDDR